MESFHLRLAKLPKNPKVTKSIKHKAYMLEVAEAFGITVEKPFSGTFYFEDVVFLKSRRRSGIYNVPFIFTVPMTPKQSFNITGGTN